MVAWREEYLTDSDKARTRK